SAHVDTTFDFPCQLVQWEECQCLQSVATENPLKGNFSGIGLGGFCHKTDEYKNTCKSCPRYRKPCKADQVAIASTVGTKQRAKGNSQQRCNPRQNAIGGGNIARFIQR